MSINYFKALLLFLLCVLSDFKIKAQENQGIINDNFNPVQGQFINPSRIVDSKPWLDINLIGINSFINNNYYFYPDTRLLNFSSFNNEPLTDNSKSQVKAYIDTEVLGPAASLVIGKQSVSIYSNLRTIDNVISLPSVVGKMATSDGINSSDTGFYQVNKARIKSLAWGEIGITYGRIIKQKDFEMITGAISVKRLFGFQSASVNVSDGLLHVVTPDSSVLLSTGSTYSYAVPDIGAGKGWGMSLGFTYKKMKEKSDNYIPHSVSSGCETPDYKYKLGVSLIDIGYVNFTRESYRGELDEVSSFDTINTTDDVLELARQLQTADRFNALLPMALSIQFDYNINDKFYVNGTIVQRIPTSNSFGVERANLLAISARYETKYIGIGLPVTLFDYRKPSVGLAFRLANLTIGTDNIIPYFFKGDIKSADIYVSLKITFYKSPQCKNKKNKKKGGKKSTNACATWD